MKKYFFGVKNILLLIVALMPFTWRMLEHFLSGVAQNGPLSVVLAVIEGICYFHIAPVFIIGKICLFTFLSKDVKHCVILNVLMSGTFILSLLLFPPPVNASVGEKGTIIVIVFLQVVCSFFYAGSIILKYFLMKRQKKEQELLHKN